MSRRPPRRPLNQTRLEELALSYVARFATSTTKLERYLQRKLRARGWDEEHEPDLAAISARYADLGYIDDLAYAKGRAGALLRRGYGPRRVREALGEAGIDEEIAADLAPSEKARRHAVLALARKRRFGPFGARFDARSAVEAHIAENMPDDIAPLDPQVREKQIAAMLRAGHMLTEVRAVLAAPDEETAEQWANEGDDEEG